MIGGLRVAAALIAFALFALPASAAPTFPALSGRVVDDAAILSPEAEAALTVKLEALEAATGRQLVVVSLRSLQGHEIEDYGYQLGRHWRIGDKGRNDGALLIVAPKERKVRIEVGYGLEGVLTDALSSVVIQTTILPKFRDGDLEGGVIAGVEALDKQLRLPVDQASGIAAGARKKQDWWVRPLLKTVVALMVTVIVPFLWSLLSGLFAGIGGRRPREIRRRSTGLVDWDSGSYGGGPSSSGGGFSGSGGSFGGGGASGSW